MHKLLTTFPICIFVLGLVGCGKGMIYPENRPLFGHYEITYKSVKSRITLNSDHTFRQVVLIGGQRKVFSGTFRPDRGRVIDMRGVWNICDDRGNISTLKAFDGISTYTIQAWREFPHLVVNPEIEGAFYTKVSKATIK